MAKIFKSGKWKKGLTIGLSLSLAATLSLGVFSACKAKEKTEEEETTEDSAALPTDTQLLKNGNFEFHSEMTKEESELRAILNTPTSWSFSSGSPSSDTKSGLIDLKYWDSITKSSYEYSSVSDAYVNWDKGSIYDKLFFYEKCKNSSNNSDYDSYQEAYDALVVGSDEKVFFNEHAFSSVDYEDVQYLRSPKTGLGESVPLHGDTETEKSEERGVLMIHNRRTLDHAVGTGQSYSSSTTITLKAGTSAKINVWVKTAQLRHYYDSLKEEGSELDGLKVTSEAGAYIGVTQTVGGTTLDQMQIKNINTEVTNPKPASGEWANNGWESYTVYVRASTFATTTVKLVLGLGQGTSDDRYEAVDGYALFDDVTCDVIDNDAFKDAVIGASGIGYDPATFNSSIEEPQGYACTIDSKKNAKLFDATKLYQDDNDYKKTFAIDLYAGFDATASSISSNTSFKLTEEKSGNNTYTSADKHASLGDNRDGSARGSITAVKSLSEIRGEATNGYLQNIAENDFKNYPSSFSEDDIILLLSSNGAAYTATLDIPGEFKIDKDGDPLLISFFVKTSAVISGRTGASIRLIDGENKTTISAFDSTTIDKVSIGTEGKEGYKEDIYDGWVQCFFFVSNDTKDEGEKTFRLEFSLGPTSIASADKYAFGQGYAAFANFEFKKLTKTELSYASTGDRAKKVSLSGIVEDSTTFDSVTASSDIENALGTPTSFKGVLAGSNWLEQGGVKNEAPAALKTGLLNHKYIDNYLNTDNDSWNSVLKTAANGKTGEAAWKQIFGDSTGIRTALQPLVIMNTSSSEKLPSYGFYANDSTISANSYQKISLRVKLSAGAKATVYLTDVSEYKDEGYKSFLAPTAPKVTYWYDDNGNICKSDPTKKSFDKDTDILFELQTNGLYRKADSDDTTYYANLRNYKDDNGNKVTKTDAIAFYGHDGKYYAYRTEHDDGSYTYDTEVKDLYDNGDKDCIRYDYSDTEFPQSKIVVDNPSSEATDWITVTFYVHTGSEAKNYRLEIWAGDRDNKTDGIPENGYVFFDRYSAGSTSNYDSLIKEYVEDLEDDENVTLDENGNLPKELAYYYTFTYYDSVNYLRYDVNEDTDELGNPYESYKQSDNSEDIISLIYDDEDGTRTGSRSYTRFLNYAASEAEVTADEDDEEFPEEEEETEEDKTTDAGDILLIVSSALLGIILIVVIVLLLVRHFLGKRKKSARAKPVKATRYRPAPEKKAEPEEAEEENPFVKNRKEKEKAEKKRKDEPAPEVEEPAEETQPEEPEEEPVEEAQTEGPTETPAEETQPEEHTEEPAETQPEEPAESAEPETPSDDNKEE